MFGFGGGEVDGFGGRVKIGDLPSISLFRVIFFVGISSFLVLILMCNTWVSTFNFDNDAGAKYDDDGFILVDC
jgi:hypothetical protein